MVSRWHRDSRDTTVAVSCCVVYMLLSLSCAVQNSIMSQLDTTRKDLIAASRESLRFVGSCQVSCTSRSCALCSAPLCKPAVLASVLPSLRGLWYTVNHYGRRHCLVCQLVAVQTCLHCLQDVFKDVLNFCEMEQQETITPRNFPSWTTWATGASDRFVSYCLHTGCLAVAVGCNPCDTLHMFAQQ